MSWAIQLSDADISSLTLAYTVPVGYETRLTAEFANRSTSATATVSLWVVPSGESVGNEHLKESGTTLGVAGTRQAVLIRRMVAPAGAKIYVQASTATVSCQLSGDVVSPDNTASALTTAVEALEDGVAYTGPTWASYATIYNGARYTINDYPIASQFGLNAVGIAEALVGAIDIPSTSAAANHSSGVAGYARSASTTQGGVGTFGFGGVTANGCNTWAMNTVSSNTSGPQGATNTGYTNTTLWGLEMDFNIYKYANAAPNVAMRGIYLTGASEIQSTSDVVYAIDIEQHGIGAAIPWKRGYTISGALGVSATDGFYTEDGATTRAINVGTTGAGNGVGSQPIYFRSRSSGGTPTNYNSYLQADADANIVLNSGNSSAVFSFQQGGTAYAQIVNGQPQFCKQSAIPAGGSSTVGVTLTSTATLGLFFGSGAPTMSAAQGSLYMRTDGSSSTTRAYVNTDGGTTWKYLTAEA